MFGERRHEDFLVLRSLESLEQLDLSGNLLTSVPPLWSPSLRSLDASRNRLSCVHLGEALREASASLLVLDLSANELHAVDLREPLLPALQDLRLDSNPWQCDCGLAPLLRFVVARNVSVDADASCGLPPELHGEAMLATVAAMPCDDDAVDAATEGRDMLQTVAIQTGHARKALAVTGVAVAVVVLAVIAGALCVAGLHRLRQRNAELRLAHEEAPLGYELKDMGSQSS